jgi:hypothetical protein
LDVPVSSQTLAYSKTSLQRHRITPRTPRALYFGDDTYVGYCKDGEVIEISTADAQLGAVFYALDTQQQDPPRLVRQADNCLICHASSNTKDVPGHVVRSVFVDASGLPLLASGTFRIDHTSPLSQRWGGWYVTGTHGKQLHLGNLIVRGRQEVKAADNVDGQNVVDLSTRFDTSAYLTPHSDIVALMVLEHQADAHNYITRAGFLTRQALHYQENLNRELGEPADKVWDSTTTRIRSACEPLVEYFLMSEEAELTDRIQGTTSFATEFVQHGPRDKQSRSLRDLDLTRRLFKHPCSYLIYSSQFAALPAEAKDYIYRRLNEVLTGEDQSKAFAHLTAEDRQAIREILLDTLPEFAVRS